MKDQHIALRGELEGINQVKSVIPQLADNQVLADIKFYRHYCREHEDYENDKATSAITHVRDTYQEVKNANKFI